LAAAQPPGASPGQPGPAVGPPTNGRSAGPEPPATKQKLERLQAPDRQAEVVGPPSSHKPTEGARPPVSPKLAEGARPPAAAAGPPARRDEPIIAPPSPSDFKEPDRPASSAPSRPTASLSREFQGQAESRVFERGPRDFESSQYYTGMREKAVSLLRQRQAPILAKICRKGASEDWTLIFCKRSGNSCQVVRCLWDWVEDRWGESSAAGNVPFDQWDAYVRGAGKGGEEDECVLVTAK
jgi:hypothetical protein